MDDSVELSPRARRYGLLVTVLAPVIPQILGSVFNIWYNTVVIEPLLTTSALRHRFAATVIFYNALAYPAAVAIWLIVISSLRSTFRALLHNETIAPEQLERTRRRVIHLPWIATIISGAAWLGCIPVFVIALATTRGTSTQLLWHLPISFLVSAFIAVTQTFFLIELASHWALFLVFFRDVRPDRLPGIRPPSLRTRGLMWAISAGLCPIGSLLLLMFAPPSPAANPQWFAVFVGMVGIAFGLCSAILITRLVAKPVDELRAAFHRVGDGDLNVRIPLQRADEFGALVGDFNQMVVELRDKERLRRVFGLHVGKQVAEQILARDPKLGGTEQNVTIMFVDLRGFTARASRADPTTTLNILNRFLHAMVHVVENEHGGMVNKFLGDGFMAVFGAGPSANAHAERALGAARAMVQRLETLNAELAATGEAALAIGIGINTGAAIVGSIGSPERMEFTVIGNTVNLASRIEGLNKPLGTTVLLSTATHDALEKRDDLIELPAQQVKGVDEPVRVFTPRGLFLSRP
jgi:adenylate cyclase